MNNQFRVFSISFLALLFVSMQAFAIEAYPSNWFVNMKNNQVQVLLRSMNDNFSKATVKVNYTGVVLKATSHFENGHYIAVDLEISPLAKP